MSFVPATSNDPDVPLYSRTIEGNQSFVETLSISAGCANDGFHGDTCDAVAASLEPNAESTCDTSAAPCTCTSIRVDAGAMTVMVAAQDGTVTAKRVEVMSTVGANWILSSGLADGDQVVVSGVQNARPGMKVRPVPVDSKAPAAAPAAPAPSPGS